MSPTVVLLLVVAGTQILFNSVLCVDFVYNTDFNSSNVLLLGTASIDSSILTLTNRTTFSIGRGLYPSKIPATRPNSSAPLPFHTSFIFSIAPYRNLLPGHGFAFVFLPFRGIDNASSSQHLGIFNFSNNGNRRSNIFGVEFDVFANEEFDDINDNHVGVDVNSLQSVATAVAGFWGGRNDGRFRELKLNNGVNYQAWIDYDGQVINVTMARAGARRPTRPLISAPLNLTGVILDEMYVGFTGSTGQLVESHRILAWSFSNTNPLIGDELLISDLPSFVLSEGSVVRSKGFIAGVSIGSVLVAGFGVVLCVYVLKRRRRKWKDHDEIEDWETAYWPHRINYKEIREATNGFSEENVIGFGGNGKVYRGVLRGTDVAVKRLNPHESVHATREFLAEVSSLGRLRHRNLVGLRGWCKTFKGSLMLVYDYMENGSVDKRIFGCDEDFLLSWEERMKVLKGIAHGLFYLHEGWEATVLHRDIKSSNVLLDKEMNAKLGDFGLARMHHHGKEAASTTGVVGTVGYMAPEVIKTGRYSRQTDVYGFGILILELVCGRRPMEEGNPGLIDWLRGLMEKGDPASALDVRLKAKGGCSSKGVERMLQLGLWCAHPNTQLRPPMGQVIKILEEAGVNDDDQTETGTMEVSLLEALNSSNQRHPTIEGLHFTASSSISLMSSEDVEEGR